MRVRLYIPDLPKASDLVGYLEQIDAAAQYTNFGPLEREFAARLARWIDPVDPPQVATFSSGTDALAIALRALRLPPGARVLTPALTFPATAFAIQAAGLTPALADVDPDQWRLTPKIAAESAGDFQAVVPVAAFGAPLPISDWDAFAEKTGIPVVIDAAAALLHRPSPRVCAAVFSLHATKPFGIGEGGLLVTPDPELAGTAVRLSNFGFDRGLVLDPSGNAKMSEYHAAVGLAQLARIAEVEARLRGVLAHYDERLPPVRRLPGLPASLVIDAPGGAAKLAQALATAGVESRRWYQPDVSRQPGFQGLPGVGPLPVCEALGERLLGLPFHTRLTAAQIQQVSDLVALAAG